MLYREAGQFKTSYQDDNAIFPIRQDRIAIWLVLVAAFVVVPLVATPYIFTGVLIPFLILSLAAIGLNILTGYAGQLSLGTAAFMAVGAFASYNLILRVPGIPMLVAFAGGGVVSALVAKNMARGNAGRSWMAVRDMDVAAEVIGIRLMRAKLSAFSVSSFYCGVAGALFAYAYLGTVEPEAFNLDLSFRILFMVIIGGVGTILGSFFGAAFVTLMPVLLSVSVRFLDSSLNLRIAESSISNLELMVFGGLIIFFLIVEPHGLARLWQIAKEKLRLWPFPH